MIVVSHDLGVSLTPEPKNIKIIVNLVAIGSL
jgi:hypothetical protein